MAASALSFLDNNLIQKFNAFCLKIRRKFTASYNSFLCYSSTTHRASTSMYSLTFCIHFLLPEHHQRKPAVQAAVVMLRTPPGRWPITGEQATPTSHIRRAILRTPPVTRQSAASSARRPRPAGRSHYVVISWDGRKLVTRVCTMLL